MSFLYITHKLREVFELADRVMVMRDGKKIDIREVEEVSENDLVSMMVGREIGDIYGGLSVHSSVGEEYFRVEDFSYQDDFQEISFGLRRGEILGLCRACWRRAHRAGAIDFWHWAERWMAVCCWKAKPSK